MSWRWAIGRDVLIVGRFLGFGGNERPSKVNQQGQLEFSAVVASARACSDRRGLGRLGVEFGGVLLRGDGGFSVALVLTLLLVEAQREAALLLGIEQTGEFRRAALA